MNSPRQLKILQWANYQKHCFYLGDYLKKTSTIIDKTMMERVEAGTQPPSIRSYLWLILLLMMMFRLDAWFQHFIEHVKTSPTQNSFLAETIKPCVCRREFLVAFARLSEIGRMMCLRISVCVCCRNHKNNTLFYWISTRNRSRCGFFTFDFDSFTSRRLICIFIFLSRNNRRKHETKPSHLISYRNLVVCWL